MSVEHPDQSSFSIEDLQDPTVDAHTLRELAAARPDLWSAILSHPNTYPELGAYIRQQMHDQEPPQPTAPPQMPSGGGAYADNSHYGGASMYQSQPPLNPDTEKTWGVVMPLASIFVGFLSPLIVWLIYKDRSPLLNAQGRHALNWTLSFLIYYFIAGLFLFFFIGLLFWGVLALLDFIFAIIGAVKAGNGQVWKYPMSIPFFNTNVR